MRVGARCLPECSQQGVTPSLSRQPTRFALTFSCREYFEITHDYPLAAAKAFGTLHPDAPFTFVYVSGEGATQTPGMFTPFYGKVKGQAEKTLLALQKDNPNVKVYNVRPGAVDWTKHPEIHPFRPPLPLWRTALMPVVGLYKSLMTPTRELGKILTDLAMSTGEPLDGKDILGEGRIVPNAAIRRITGL